MQTFQIAFFAFDGIKLHFWKRFERSSGIYSQLFIWCKAMTNETNEELIIQAYFNCTQHFVCFESVESSSSLFNWKLFLFAEQWTHNIFLVWSGFFVVKSNIRSNPPQHGRSIEKLNATIIFAWIRKKNTCERKHVENQFMFVISNRDPISGALSISIQVPLKHANRITEYAVYLKWEQRLQVIFYR